VPQTEWGWEITEGELRSWILHEDRDLLVVNKPGLVVCHPSKHGPWSSLIGAAREYTGLPVLHMPSRLDRETSGVVVLVKDTSLARRLQKLVEQRRVRKQYLAILEGRLPSPVRVDQPLGKHPNSAIAMRQAVVEGGARAVTEFTPLWAAGGYTFAAVRTETGRLHQIRVHAAWLGHAVAGDKLYGPDESLYLEFARQGFTDHLAAVLPIARQALHATALECDGLSFFAPLAEDLRRILASATG
jgi:23S rRNA pseudouridine1911/1915/1917 synthase